MSQPQAVLPQGQACAACTQPASGFATFGGITRPYCAAHLASLQAPVAPAQPDGQADPLRDGVMRWWRPGMAVPEGVSPAEAEADYRMGVDRLLRTEQQRREARRLADAQDRQPVILSAASAVWDEPDLTYLVRGMIPEVGIGTLFGERSPGRASSPCT